MSLWDLAILKKRYIIKTVNSQLKNISYIKHCRHRSITGFMINMLAGLIAYCLKETMPDLDLYTVDFDLIRGTDITVA